MSDGDRFSKDPFFVPAAEAEIDLSPLRNGVHPRIGDWIKTALADAYRDRPSRPPDAGPQQSTEEPRPSA